MKFIYKELIIDYLHKNWFRSLQDVEVAQEYLLPLVAEVERGDFEFRINIVKSGQVEISAEDFKNFVGELLSL